MKKKKIPCSWSLRPSGRGQSSLLCFSPLLSWLLLASVSTPAVGKASLLPGWHGPLPCLQSSHCITPSSSPPKAPGCLPIHLFKLLLSILNLHFSIYLPFFFSLSTLSQTGLLLLDLWFWHTTDFIHVCSVLNALLLIPPTPCFQCQNPNHSEKLGSDKISSRKPSVILKWEVMFPSTRLLQHFVTLERFSLHLVF